jgi:hypothetical protein
MSWRIENLQVYASDMDAVAFPHAHRNNVGAASLSHYCNAVRDVTKGPKTRNVVGMGMSVDGLDQFDVKLSHQLEVMINFVEHGIDDKRLASATSREKIAVCATFAIEELPK